MDNKGASRGETIFSIAFLSWFVLSIAALIVTAKAKEMGWVAIVFGQYFVVFGVAGLVNEIKGGFRHPIIITLPLVGFSVVTCGLLWQFGDAAMQEQVVKQIPNVICGVFFIVGLLLLSGIVIDIIVQKKCTYSVQGKCVEVKSHYSSSSNGRNRMKYCPVYEYHYNGQTYTGSQEIYTNIIRINEGECREIFLDPNKPTVFYEKGMSGALNVVSLFIGIAFLVVSTIAVYAYNFM